jgi:hypothetical protein
VAGHRDDPGADEADEDVQSVGGQEPEGQATD